MLKLKKQERVQCFLMMIVVELQTQLTPVHNFEFPVNLKTILCQISALKCRKTFELCAVYTDSSDVKS